MRARRFVLLMAVGPLLFWTACGGGGGGGSTVRTPITTPSPSTPPTITTESILPPTLMGHAYTTTLAATGGTGALHWSMSPISSTTLFPDGLQIDENTGVISGTANFGGTAGFVAKVTDSASPANSATKSFTVTANEPLSAPATQSALTVRQYRTINFPITVTFSNGVPPVTFSVPPGVLPPGMRLSQDTGMFSGTPTTLGTFQGTITLQDSFSPPETVSTTFSITIVPPDLSLEDSLPSRIPLNTAFSGSVVANGGVPPYTFAISNGLPPGLSFDGNTGAVTGTPTASGNFGFNVTVTDSVPTQVSRSFAITVAPKLGRNDTIQTATVLGNGDFRASISPYIDPPVVGSIPGDNDYYKLRGLAGNVVHIETRAKSGDPGNPLDTVLEIVDANGARLTTCRLPNDTSTNFNSACMNDDISLTPVHNQDSELDLQVPASATVFYAHVLDWRGDARPDMTYDLVVNGAVDPMKISTQSLTPATNGVAYSSQLSVTGGNPPISWTVTVGSLPPGLSIDSSTGVISGAPTTNGSYTFTAQAADTEIPAQTDIHEYTIVVADPIKITSSATFPDACLNQPYSFTVQLSGGTPPLRWGFNPATFNWPVGLDTATGTFSGTPTTAGTFSGFLSVGDAANSFDNQTVSLTVKTCP